MHTDDIKAVVHRASLDALYKGKGTMVYVTTTKDGKKLYFGRGFVADKNKATPLSYDLDRVGDQVFEAGIRLGILLDVEPVI